MSYKTTQYVKPSSNAYGKQLILSPARLCAALAVLTINVKQGAAEVKEVYLRAWLTERCCYGPGTMAACRPDREGD